MLQRYVAIGYCGCSLVLCSRWVVWYALRLVSQSALLGNVHRAGKSARRLWRVMG